MCRPSSDHSWQRYVYVRPVVQSDRAPDDSVIIYLSKRNNQAYIENTCVIVTLRGDQCTRNRLIQKSHIKTSSLQSCFAFGSCSLESLNSMVVRFNRIITPSNGSSYPKANLQQILKLCKVAIVSSSNPHAADMNVKLPDTYIYRQETSS